MVGREEGKDGDPCRGGKSDGDRRGRVVAVGCVEDQDADESGCDQGSGLGKVVEGGGSGEFV